MTNAEVILMILGALLTLAFTLWAGVVHRAALSMTKNLEAMRGEMHEFVVRTEHRMTLLESKTHTPGNRH